MRYNDSMPLLAANLGSCFFWQPLEQLSIASVGTMMCMFNKQMVFVLSSVDIVPCGYVGVTPNLAVLQLQRLPLFDRPSCMPLRHWLCFAFQPNASLDMQTAMERARSLAFDLQTLQRCS